MRDDNYLQGRLDYLWDRYFADVGQNNDVRIQFGRRARTRLGSIKQLTTNPSASLRAGNQQLTGENPNSNVQTTKLDFGQARMTREGARDHKPTLITINGLFKDNSVPEFLIDSVIAHEMVHYAHGFASPHEKKYDTPHAGGVIKKEMQERGLEDLYLLQKKWLKENWREFVAKHLPRKIRVRRRRRKQMRFIKIF